MVRSFADSSQRTCAREVRKKYVFLLETHDISHTPTTRIVRIFVSWFFAGSWEDHVHYCLFSSPSGTMTVVQLSDIPIILK